MTAKIAFAVIALLLAGTAVPDELLPPPRTGGYTLSMTPAELLGDAAAAELSAVLAPDREISFELFVAGNYSHEAPAGILIFVSPSTRGDPPGEWYEAIGKHNLVWIGVNGLGNRAALPERMLTAMIAPSVVASRYRVDANRCYIAGFSAGGVVAARVEAMQPAKFRGAIYMAGAALWDESNPPDIERIGWNRHVFVVGADDPARDEMRRVFAGFKDAGIDAARLIEVPRHRHRLPPAADFDSAVGYLDGSELP